MLVNRLKDRLLPDGGFSLTFGGGYRVDATCWAILALNFDTDCREILAKARTRLATAQFPDGRVCISPDHPETVWPTSLSIFAWHQSPDHRDNLARAANFLMNSSGTHSQRPPDAPYAHDPSIKGWSWIADTHSWEEPTALAMMALKIAGYGGHDRVKEGARLLLDRQLPSGGWNFGSTIIYDRELRPMPLNTGLALNALIEETDFINIERSLSYLLSIMPTLHAPRSLAWGLLGIGAWKSRYEPSEHLIDSCLKNETKYGFYDTTSLSLLQIASRSSGGLKGIFSGMEKS